MIEVFVVSLLVSAGQLCQKRAADAWCGRTLSLRERLRAPWFVAAVVFLGLGMVLWLDALRCLPVGVAYPMLSLNFIWVTLAARVLFHEPTDWRHGLGTLLIVAGVTCLAPAM